MPVTRPVPNVGGKGSYLRRTSDGGYRSIVAVGGPAFTSIANAASATVTFAFQEPSLLGKLTVMGSAAVALVAGNGLDGGYLTSLNIGGDSILSNFVPLRMFDCVSLNSPRFGHTVHPSVALNLITLNESGATVEYGYGFSVE